MLLTNLNRIGLLMRYVGPVMSLKIFIEDYCGGEGYLQGFVLDFKMLDKKLQVFGEQKRETIVFRNDKAQERCWGPARFIGKSLEATFKSWLALAWLTEFPHVSNIELVLR